MNNDKDIILSIKQSELQEMLKDAFIKGGMRGTELAIEDLNNRGMLLNFDTLESQGFKTYVDLLMAYLTIVKKFNDEGFGSIDEFIFAYNRSRVVINEMDNAPTWYETIEGKEVSVDVSTGDDDADHRIYGTVTEVMLCKYGAGVDTILVEETSRNF
jgi:hypothetical protein